jgi:hypothetical protein
MITLLLHLLRLLPFLVGGQRQLALENLALRHQLAVYKRTATRPKLRTADRLLWVWLARVWAGWRQALVIVSPDTVLRWQRRRFREHWTRLSSRPRPGRPPIRALIRTIAATNPLWGAPRICLVPVSSLSSLDQQGRSPGEPDAVLAKDRRLSRDVSPSSHCPPARWRRSRRARRRTPATAPPEPRRRSRAGRAGQRGSLHRI